jgi:hypothetical protein
MAGKMPPTLEKLRTPDQQQPANGQFGVFIFAFEKIMSRFLDTSSLINIHFS